MERAEILTSGRELGFLILGGTRHQKGCESRGQTGTECQDEQQLSPGQTITKCQDERHAEDAESSPVVQWLDSNFLCGMYEFFIVQRSQSSVHILYMFYKYFPR